MKRHYLLEEYLPIHLYSESYREKLISLDSSGLLDFPPDKRRRKSLLKRGKSQYKTMLNNLAKSMNREICPRNEQEARKMVVNLLRERDGVVCKICNKELVFGKEIIDHILPICIGGTHAADNIRLAHEKCNFERNKELPDEVLMGFKNAFKK